MKKTIYCLSVILCELLLAGVSGHAQQLKLGNNPTVIDKTALLELESNNQGLLLPRISDTNAFHPNPIPNGMLIYYVGTSDSCLMVRKDGRWVKIVDFVNLAGQETDPVATAKTVSITAGNTAIAVAGGTQTLGNNPNFTLTVPNTNPIWNASQLQGVSISSTSPTTDQLLQYNGTNWVPWTPNYLPASNINGTTNYVSKFTGGNTLGNSIIYDNGKVGIGSTSPDSLLTVNGSGHFTSNLRLDKGLSLAGNYGTANQVLTSNGAGNLPSWSTLSTLETDPTAWKLTGNAGTTPGTNFLGTTDNNDLVFKTNNTERMRVSASNGNVGIGTPSPTYPLTVNGTASAIGVFVAPDGSNNAKITLGYNSGGTAQIVPNLSSDFVWQGGWSKALQMAAYHEIILNGGRASTTLPGFYTGNGSTYNTRIINTNANTVGLTVEGINGQTGDLQRWIVNGTTKSVVNNNGYLAINKTTAAQPLDVNGNIQFSGALMPAGNAGTTGQVLVSQGAGAAPQWQNPSTALNAWSLTGNAGTSSSSNFIGTTDYQGITFKTNNQNAGYIGVGGGESNVSLGAGSFADYQSTAFGANATAKSLSGGSSQSVAVGYNASATGYLSTAIGNSASATQNDNIAVGSNAQATGYQSMALGNAAMASGQNSVAIGNADTASAQNSVVIGNGVSTNQANAFILGNNSNNVGIHTTTPQANLDVNGNFKLGQQGKVLNSIFDTTIYINNTFQFDWKQTLTITVTVPNVVQGATVIINPRTPLPATNGSGAIGIGWVAALSNNQISINFINTGDRPTNKNYTITFDVLVIQ